MSDRERLLAAILAPDPGAFRRYVDERLIEKFDAINRQEVGELIARLLDGAPEEIRREIGDV